ncbi:MAG: DUF1801 domain-containing protein [Gemmatimonadales bacterium]|nr:MAG: DUF1801 domain-containing protein [Gemmatimonadales bacterium]
MTGSSTRDIPEPLRELLATAPPELQTLFLEGRSRILALYPDATETVTPGYRSVGYGPGSRMSQQSVALIFHSRHVNLQFFRGASLSDPGGLLEGTGKAMRHVKLRSPADLDQPGLAALMTAAIKQSLDPTDSDR